MYCSSSFAVLCRTALRHVVLRRAELCCSEPCCARPVYLFQSGIVLGWTCWTACVQSKSLLWKATTSLPANVGPQSAHYRFLTLSGCVCVHFLFTVYVLVLYSHQRSIVCKKKGFTCSMSVCFCALALCLREAVSPWTPAVGYSVTGGWNPLLELPRAESSCLTPFLHSPREWCQGVGGGAHPYLSSSLAKVGTGTGANSQCNSQRHTGVDCTRIWGSEGSQTETGPCVYLESIHTQTRVYSMYTAHVPTNIYKHTGTLERCLAQRTWQCRGPDGLSELSAEGQGENAEEGWAPETLFTHSSCLPAYLPARPSAM